MQLGFVIDQSRCIGCHACTVACKSENDVPVGSFRTWVKYTEAGRFPEVRRSFTVLRCNQCTAAPCVTICPVGALENRPDGIVDVDPAACIGCKACMQGCPYDALYINEDRGTAEKCHFCAHRTEVGLAPACAVVCPTEAIVPGDFDDPDSAVSRLRRGHDLKARKAEAGTGPNVLYRDVAPEGIDPLRTNGAAGSIWANPRPGPQLEAAEFEALERRAEARTTYDVSHPPLWGKAITGYLFAKSLAAGLFLAGAFAELPPFGGTYPPAVARDVAVPLLALFFLALTSALLVLDLKRPERFHYILTRPNWSSWLTRGTWILIAYGSALAGWSAAGLAGFPAAEYPVLRGTTFVLAALAACYTAWLFGQAKGRPLWMRRGLWVHLVVQAGLAGNALLMLLDPFVGVSSSLAILRTTALVWLALHLVATAMEGRLAPRGREAEYARTLALVHRGPYAGEHRLLGIGVGIALPLALVLVAEVLPGAPWLTGLAAVAILVGLWVEESILVRAGQALSIS